MARLHRAARRGDYDEVAAALAGGANVNAVSVHRFSALLLAAREGHYHVVKLLLKAGADTRLAHPNGRTALHFAAGAGRLEVVRLLAAKGADVNAISRIGRTPMIEAALFCHADVVTFLENEAAADVSRRDPAGLTAAEWLALGGVPGVFNKTFGAAARATREHTLEVCSQLSCLL